MTVETRYFNGTTGWTVNGLTALKLWTALDGILNSVSASGTGDVTVMFGWRVWKRDSTGTETEITSGTPVAQVSVLAGGPTGINELDATWECPLTVLASTDSIVTRVYIKIGAGSWTELQTWTTEQLGAQSLDSATWTFHCWIQRAYLSVPKLTRGQFYFGTNTYNSRITNFTWTPAAVAIFQGDGLTGWS